MKDRLPLTNADELSLQSQGGQVSAGPVGGVVAVDPVDDDVGAIVVIIAASEQKPV